MRSRRLKRPTIPANKKMAKNSVSTTIDKNDTVQSSRPVRQRKVTKKLQESYSTVPSSLLNGITNTVETPPNNIIKLEMNIKEEPSYPEEEDYTELAQQLLKTLNQSRKEFSDQFIPRKEIFEDVSSIKIKEEAREESPYDSISIPKLRQIKIRRIKPVKAKTTPTTVRTSIFQHEKLRPRESNLADRLPKPQFPNVINKHIELDYVKPMIGSLIQGLEIDFKSKKLQESFRIAQSSIVKNSPCLLPVFIDIMRETMTNMRNYGYFEAKTAQVSGEDRLMKMLSDLQSMRLNVTESHIKQ